MKGKTKTILTGFILLCTPLFLAFRGYDKVIVSMLGMDPYQTMGFYLVCWIVVGIGFFVTIGGLTK